jgi:broad specificity phosphatase PhoE
MVKLYLVRHGEAAASWEQNPDPGLSKNGLLQAQGVVDLFEDQAIESVHASPLLRARETAAPLAQARRFACHIDDAFREIPTPTHITMSQRLHWLRSCADDSWQQQGEELLIWRQRILNSLMALQCPTVIFTHFMVMNAVAGYLMQDPRLVHYQPDYCSVLSVENSDSGLKLLDLGQQATSRVL